MKIQIKEYTYKIHRDNSPRVSKGFISDFGVPVRKVTHVAVIKPRSQPIIEEGTPIVVRRASTAVSLQTPRQPVPAFHFETALDMSLPADSSLKRDDMRFVSRIFLIACGITIASIGGQYLFAEYNNSSWNILITVFSIIIFALGSAVAVSYCVPLVWRKRH